MNNETKNTLQCVLLALIAWELLVIDLDVQSVASGVKHTAFWVQEINQNNEEHYLAREGNPEGTKVLEAP